MDIKYFKHSQNNLKSKTVDNGRRKIRKKLIKKNVTFRDREWRGHTTAVKKTANFRAVTQDSNPGNIYIPTILPQIYSVQDVRRIRCFGSRVGTGKRSGRQ